MYRHPNSNLTENQTNIEKTLEKLNLNHSMYYICGDINIDLHKENSNTSIQHYINSLHTLGCTQLFKYATRITGSSATLLDHIYTNNSSQQVYSHILLSNIPSDHLPLILMLRNFQPTKLSYRTKKRSMKNVVPEDFLTELNEFLNVYFGGIKAQLPVNDSFEQFISIFKSVVDKHAPLKQMTRNEQKLANKP